MGLHVAGYREADRRNGRRVAATRSRASSALLIAPQAIRPGACIRFITALMGDDDPTGAASCGAAERVGAQRRTFFIAEDHMATTFYEHWREVPKGTWRAPLMGGENRQGEQPAGLDYPRFLRGIIRSFDMSRSQ